MKKLSGEKVFDYAVNISLVLIAIIVLYPIWYVLIASISSPQAIANGEVLLFPKGINFAAYRKLLDNKMIWIGYKNSILYTAAATVLHLVVVIPCAYALSVKRLPGRSFFMTLFVITMYFSGGMIPTYLLINSLGMINTPWAMIVPGCVSAYNMIVARSFFESNIPDSLLDAARIDGCGYTRFFLNIVIPLSPAVIAIIALFVIQANWNGYLSAQMYLYDSDLFTLQQVIKGITAKIDQSLAADSGMTMEQMLRIIQERQLLKYAVVIVSSIPLVILYPFIQKFFVKGIMVGAVKE